MTEPLPAAPESREIRVFLSSTFRDFMEERDLLVKQVFPRLRRKAKERGVEIVDVDLRWGITEEESQQGKVIGICLSEIERCRPYFIGMLGERYGWTPQPSDYPPALFEREQLQWIKDHQGDASVTELEILHGVLNDPKMAGRAFFYFRDPAWSQAQSEPGFVCDTPEEEAKLAALKDRICASSFPARQNLPDPQAIADRIEADLWELIEELYPDLDTADALEQESRKHASFRLSRLGIYLGGEEYIQDLESHIEQGEQQILISGESGAGKSALIANWIAVHEQAHPDDIIYVHHLGCSADANAIRPLLGRLIDTAKVQLPEALGYTLKVPQDWWELVAKVVEALQSLGRWAQQNNHRWIWVLDGLDRLSAEDQNALPWLPITIPEGVVLLASALECPAQTILLERKFQNLTIGPLQQFEKDALIQQYLGRFTKQLLEEMRDRTVQHRLAGSPLFLRVLLEELRQCGRYETLSEQLDGYLQSETIDDLYEMVLARLEAEVSFNVVHKLMTTLWASRAGLCEDELLKVTQVVPLQWAPIDLALEQSLGRNGSRLVFDHAYLRKAVEDRYLTSQDDKRDAHGNLARFYAAQEGWNERKAEELPWQLSASQRISDLQCLLADPESIYSLVNMRGSAEIVRFIAFLDETDPKLYGESFRELTHLSLKNRKHDLASSINFLDCLADLIYGTKGDAETLVMLREKAYEISKKISNKKPKDIVFSMMNLATAHEWKGDLGEAVRISEAAVSQSHHIDNLAEDEKAAILNNFASILSEAGDKKRAREVMTQAKDIMLQLSTAMGPSTADVTSNLGFLMIHEDLDNAEMLLSQALAYYNNSLGENHTSTAISKSMLASVLLKKGKADEAILLFIDCLACLESMLGRNHPDAITTYSELAKAYSYLGNRDIAEKILEQSLVALSEGRGSNSSMLLWAVNNLASHYQDSEQGHKIEAVYNQTFPFLIDVVSQTGAAAHDARVILIDHYINVSRPKCAIPIAQIELSIASQLHEKSSNEYLNAAWRMGQAYFLDGDFESSARVTIDTIEAASSEQTDTDPDVMAFKVALSQCLGHLGDHFLASTLRKEHFKWSVEKYGELHDDTLDSMHEFGCALLRADQLDEAFDILTQCLSSRERHHGSTNNLTLDTLVKLLEALSRKGMQKDGIDLCKRFRREIKESSGNADPRSINILISQAYLNVEIGRLGQALKLLSWFFVLARIYRNQALCTKEARALMAQLRSGAAKRDGRDAPGTLTSIHRLAEDLYWADELEESEQLYREALTGRIAALGDDDGSTMASRYGLARCLSAQQRYSEAIELRRVELAWCQANDDVDAKDMLISMHDLACDLLATGETEEALEGLQICLNQRRAEIGVSDDDTLATLARVLEALSSLGRQQEGLELSQDVQQALAAELGDNDPRVLNQIGNQAVLYEDIDEMEQAEVLYRRCLAGREAVLGPDHPDTVSTAFSLAEVLSEQDRRAEAIPLRRRELAWCRQQNGDTDPGTLNSINGLAIDLRETGELEEAEALFRELMEGRQQVLEPNDFGIGLAFGGLAKTLEEAGKLEEALDYSQQALDHWLEHEGPDAWWTNRERLDLAHILHKLGRSEEATQRLDALQASITSNAEPDDDDRQLLADAAALRDQIEVNP